MSRAFDEALQKYAELAIQAGVNVQPGQRLVIWNVPVQLAPFVRQLAAAAYRRGASLVDIFWVDDGVTLARFQHAPKDSFAEFPTWMSEGLRASAERGDAVISVSAATPGLLNGQDPESVATYTRSRVEHVQPFRALTMRNAMNWNVVAAASPGWAAQVFPDVPEQEQQGHLWEAIFRTCRVDRPNPVAAWEQHVAQLGERAARFTRKQHTALRFTGPGTDLTVGLPPGHVWRGGNLTSQKGIPFAPNIPTEEIFTMPHTDRVDGVVRSTRPLDYAGTLIQDFALRFEHGRVVEASAAQGEVALRNLLDTDEGARRLGEVALVPHSSPISQSGLLFYNTIFDENASCHFALGRAYRFTLRDGESMTNDEFARAGGNFSLEHVDFMVGSGAMDIDGLTAGGAAEPVMREGEWV